MGMKDKLLLELIIVLALVGYGLWTYSDNPNLFTGNTQINPVQETMEDTDTKNTGVPAGTSAPDYGQALLQYKDARIQLDQNCKANPTNLTFKNNTSVMIDNRANISRVVKVGSTFTIPAYGFEIVKLTSSSLPDTWYVDCGTSQNVATILIQR